MFHRPKTEDTGSDTQVVEKAAASGSAVKPQTPVQQGSISQQTENHTEEKKMSAREDQEGKQQAPARSADIPGQKSYQTMQTGTAPRIPGNYAYPGSTAQTGGGVYGAHSSSTAVAGKGRRLVISEGITMSGEIESCDYVLVEGTLEAALKGASVLEIAETGVFYGTVEIDEAMVAGRFEGDITVNGRLTITATGSITGTVAYKELAVEAGATVDGKMNPLVSKNTAKKGDKPSSAKGGGKHPSRDSNDGSELPFSGSNAAAA